MRRASWADVPTLLMIWTAAIAACAIGYGLVHWLGLVVGLVVFWVAATIVGAVVERYVWR